MRLWFFVVLSTALFGKEPIDIKKIATKQVELSCYVRGKGKPLVMIMDYRGTMAMWDPALLDLLEKRYQLVLFDPRGIGLSTDTAENQTTISQMADDIKELLKTLKFSRASFLGWGMGAGVAQQMAIRHPEMVEKLILCSPSPGGKRAIAASPETLQRLYAPRLTEEERLSLLFPAGKDGIAAARAYKTRVGLAFIERKIPDDFAVAKSALDRQRYACTELWERSEENYEALSKISAPTLVCAGMQDLIEHPENAKLVIERIPHAWSAYFPGGHAFLFQEHQKFADLVHLFLD